MDPVVETLCGKVRGAIAKSSEGFDYLSFRGIPYAEPPKGELRFKDPVPTKKWTGIKDATNFGCVCAQYNLETRVFSDSEDYLTLNVYTKSISKSDNDKAVMVWIHGGGFSYGSSNEGDHDPDYLIGKDVVLVTISYRLNVFGFLNVDDEVAPGNQGLKDQVLALRWIKDNINAFGGDANNVTIFGESAGGASVHYLTLSPLAKGLFHKAILQSGAAISPWASTVNPKENAQKLCSILGKNLVDPKEIVQFLQTVDPRTLSESVEKLRNQIATLPFGPTTDTKSHEPFMPSPIEIAAKDGVHIPCLIGHTSREGIFFVLAEVNKKDVLALMDQDFKLALGFGGDRLMDSYNLNPNQLKRLYFKSEKVTEENIDKLADFTGDLHIVDGVHKVIKTQVEKSSAPTYMYCFSYDPGHSVMKSMLKGKISGASHYDEVRYILKLNNFEKWRVSDLKKGTQEHKVMQQMTELWTNFAKYGRPTVEISQLIPLHWQPVGNDTVFRYLNIDEDLTMQSMLNIERKFIAARDIKA